jgi:hypothetical protein
VESPHVSLFGYAFACTLCTARRFPSLSAVAILQKLTAALSSYIDKVDSVFTGRRLQSITDNSWVEIQNIITAEGKIFRFIYDKYVNFGLPSSHSPSGTLFTLNSVALFAKDFSICPQLINFNTIVLCFRYIVFDDTNLLEFQESENDLSLSLSNFCKFIGILSYQCDCFLIREALSISISEIPPNEEQKQLAESSFTRFLIWLDSSGGKNKLSCRTKTVRIPLFNVTKAALLSGGNIRAISSNKEYLRSDIRRPKQSSTV